ncbi:MAG: carbamoyltransferase HypF, partial [Lachnospiraceae bacterium]|nr:carbamoyltransferase HypF [Lachnospiraceae bacterium]
MLPCDGIQALLLEDGNPLVMTSANRGGQPITGDDTEALALLREGACDIVLANDRMIINPLDDPIYRVTEIKGKSIVQILRRARGLVPDPVTIKRKTKDDVFAAGGDMKASFAYARDDQVFFGGHFGDLSEEEARRRRAQAEKRLEYLLDLRPGLYAADRHPGYFSLREMKDKGPELIQHHRAHLLSVAAEHGLSGKLVGASFDGTGYGDDGNIWGGEFLILDTGIQGGCKRAGHLMSVRLTGGDTIAYDAEKAAMCFAYEALSRGLLLEQEEPFSGEKYGIIKKALQNDINVHLSSSAGRFFDACTAMLGICMTNSYEGECPARLQAKAEEISEDGIRESSTGLKAFIVNEGEMQVVDTVRLFSDLAGMKKNGTDIRMLAYDLHLAISDAIVRCIVRAGNEAGTKKALLGGGTFANSLLIKMILPALEEKGFEVFVNEKVPPGDGGLALGQIYAVI